MAWVLFAVGATAFALTLHSHRPLRWPGTLVLPAWFASWPIIELSLHLAVVTSVVVALIALEADLSLWPAQAGLAMAIGAVVGLVWHARLAWRTPDVLAKALRQGLDLDHVATAADGDRSRWFRLLRGFPIRHRRVERLRNVEYHRIGRRGLILDVYRLRGAQQHSGGKRPVFLYVHGGGWVIGNKGQQGLLTVNHLAARGWLCVSINYRLSPRATFPEHLYDVKRAIAWVKANAESYGGDPKFVIIGGGSAGAHLAALAALTPGASEYQRDYTDTDTAVQGLIGYYGVYDFCDRHGHWPHTAFRMLLERAIMKRRFRDAREEFENASPIARVGDHAPPTFLIHGDRDNLAPCHESRCLAAALRASSKHPVVHAELPGAQHAFELFPSLRSLATVDAVGTFCEAVHRRYLDTPAIDGVHSRPRESGHQGTHP
jgi:acetyl esterase/lipase